MDMFIDIIGYGSLVLCLIGGILFAVMVATDGPKLPFALVAFVLAPALYGASIVLTLREMNAAVSPQSVVSSESTDEKTERKARTVSMGPNEFRRFLKTTPVSIELRSYITRDHSALYPDMMQVILRNNTELDIKDAVIAFVAWDKNELPVKIEGQFEIFDGDYIRLIAYNDINLSPGAAFGDSSGFSLDQSCHVARFEAVAVSYVAFTGETWTNPYYEKWRKMYEGVKYADTLKTDVKVDADWSYDPDTDPANMTLPVLNAEIAKQDVRVIDTNYAVQSEKFKGLHPDVLQAIVRNDSRKEIQNMKIAYAAWDKDRFPVKIKANFDTSGGAYIARVNYDDIHLRPGETYGESSGFEIDDDIQISEFKAIVYSYEAEDGTTWFNPLFERWCELHEGVRLDA